MDEEAFSVSRHAGARVIPSFAALDAISHYAAITPQASALIDPDGVSLTYSRLWSNIEALSSRLQQAGVRAGERVAVLLPPGAIQILSLVGVLYRHVCLPLSSRAAVAEIESSLNRLSASVLIVSCGQEAAAKAAMNMGLAVVVARDEESPKDWEIRAFASRSGRAAAYSNAVLILVTSATTGQSKVVPLTAENIDAGAESRRRSLQLTVSDRLLSMTSLSHIIGVENSLAQFVVGGTVIATGGFDPTTYLRWLTELRPTWYDCAPTIHQAALLQLQTAPLDQPVTLRFVQSAGAPLPDEVRKGLEQILHVPVFNDYGMTEACPIAADAFLPGGRSAGSAGRSCGLQIGIMEDCGQLLSTGEEGEIVVRGPAVFSGYLDDPDANRRAFHDGWFRTGDLGRLDQDGNLYVTGRLKEMINRGGEKISPTEVDAVLALHPAVLDAASFAIPHPTLGEDIACAVVLRPSGAPPVSAGELRRFAAERLASFKVPRRISFVDEIPRGELGKPQRWQLAERLSREHTASPPSPAEVTEQFSSNHIIEYLVEIWGRILDRDDLGFDEDFFEAGGDSLAAINVLAEVDQRLGSRTSDAAASFIDEPTLAHLADLVGAPPPPRPAQSDSADIQMFPIGERGSSTELFCIPSDGEEGFCFRRLVKHLGGQMNVSIVRPANTWYARSLDTTERAAAEAAARIREVQPQGPYFVCGNCLGGVIAVEVVQQLSHDGQEAGVILFDTIMPAFPGFFSNSRLWVQGAKRQWHRIWTAEHPGLHFNILRFSSRLLWSALVPLRRFLRPVEQAPIVKRIVDFSQLDNYPLCKLRPMKVPCLHILSADEPEILHAFHANSRFRWKSIARGGIEERFVPLNHYNVLHESNLPEIARILIKWCGDHGAFDAAHGRQSANEDLEPMHRV